jgi:hypothetical protein
MAEEVREPTQADIQLTTARYELFKWVIPAVWIAAAWIPLQAARPITNAFAGKHTAVSVVLTFSFSLTISIALGGGFFAMWRRTRAQRDEIIRLRRRTARLETDLKNATNS